MRILFRTLSHADHFLRVCRLNLDEAIESPGNTRLPSQRIDNIFCQSLGYGSYDDLQGYLKTASIPRPTQPGNAMVGAAKDGFSKALSLAASRGFTVLQRIDGEPMVDWLGMCSVLQYAAWQHEMYERQSVLDPLETGLAIRAGSLIGAAFATVAMRNVSVDHIYKEYWAGGWKSRGWSELGLALVKYGVKETGELVGPEHDYYRLGRYLYAAVWAARNGRTSVDHVLKTKIPEQIDEAWIRCAEDNFQRMGRLRAEKLNPFFAQTLECHWCLDKFVGPSGDFVSIEARRERAREQGWTTLPSADLGEHQEIPSPDQSKVDACPACSQIRASWLSRGTGQFPEDFPRILAHRTWNSARADIERLELGSYDYSHVGDQLLVAPLALPTKQALREAPTPTTRN
jgi:hypothetical protein